MLGTGAGFTTLHSGLGAGKEHVECCGIGLIPSSIPRTPSMGTSSSLHLWYCTSMKKFPVIPVCSLQNEILGVSQFGKKKILVLAMTSE